MGRREKWYSKIKKVLSPGSKPRRINASSKKSGSKMSGNQSHLSQVIVPVESVPVRDRPTPDVGLSEAMNDQNKLQIPQLSETAAALAPKIASGIMRHIPVTLSRPLVKWTMEDTAATQIQTAYRCYLARRTLRALRGLVRLKFLVQGQSVKRQATNTLQCIQALARVQSQARSRRLHKENQALQKQLLLKNSKKHTPFRNSDDWKDCAQSKQRDEEKMKKKHEAALRRERTLAYSSVHQQTWKSSPKRPSNMTETATDPNNPNWGWSWLERWMAGRPLEDLHSRSEITEIGTTKKPPQSIKISPKPPPSPALKPTSMGENNKPGSARTRLSNASGSDSSQKNRRHSFAGSPPAREYEISVGSNSPRRSHTMPAKLLNTKPRSQSPLGLEHNGTTPRKSSSARQTDKPVSHLVKQSSSRYITQQGRNVTTEIS